MAYQQRNGLHEQPLGELLKQLSNQVSTLARQEVELAKAELAAKGRVLGRAAASSAPRRSLPSAGSVR